MKKLLILLCVTLISTITVAQSPQEKMATDILKQVSTKYRSLNSIKAEFSYTLNNPEAKINETQEGSLVVKQKEGMYKVILPMAELFSDGKFAYVYLKESQEVQINNIDKSGEALDPAQIFTMYEKGFKSIYVKEEKLGSTTSQLIELVPLAEKNYFKIELSIDKAKKQILQVKVFDKNGSTYAYKLKNFVENPKLDESIFIFDKSKYPDAEVVDLR